MCFYLKSCWFFPLTVMLMIAWTMMNRQEVFDPKYLNTD